MKKYTLVLLLVFLLLNNIVLISQATEESTTLVDSGINYSDAKETVARNDYLKNEVGYDTRDALLLNPERGFLSTNTLRLTETGSVPIDASSWTGSLLLLKVELSDFSGAYHLNPDGTKGPDKHLTQNALDALDTTLSNLKKNNRQVILRPQYDRDCDGIHNDEGYADANGKRIVEPDQSMILSHIEEMAPIFIKYQDVIYTIQEGIYGACGELHTSPMCTNSNINETLTKLLEVTRGTEIPISIRTPSRYAYFKGIDVKNIESSISLPNEDAYRIAIFNDGYLGSHSDLGTYFNREKEINWLSKQSEHTPYGGEAVVNIDQDENGIVNNMGVMSSMENVKSEMPRTHTSYLNFEWRQDLHKEWAKTIYDGKDEFENDNLYKFIEYHLGYRFVIRKNLIQSNVTPGNKLKDSLTLENVGFGNVLKSKIATLFILDKDQKVVHSEKINLDAKSFKSGTKTKKDLEIKIPETLPPSNYKLYLQFKVSDQTDGTPYGSIRFANKDIWNSTIEANYLGDFNIVEKTVDPDNTNPTPEQMDTDNKNSSGKYKILDGENQEYSFNENAKLSFRANIDFATFINNGKVFIDENEISKQYYGATSGSTIITFTNDFAKNITPGTHSFKAVVNDGFASCNFKILESKNNPTTGFSNNTKTDNKDSNKFPSTVKTILETKKLSSDSPVVILSPTQILPTLIPALGSSTKIITLIELALVICVICYIRYEFIVEKIEKEKIKAIKKIKNKKNKKQ